MASGMHAVNRQSIVPLYHQVTESLRERIESREWEPGTKIPTEKELAAEYGVSQITVKQALLRLVQEGLVERRQGSGTYVLRPSLVHIISEFGGFSTALARSGVEVETRLIEVGISQANEAIAQRLSLSPGDAVLVARRLRVVAGEPIGLQTSYLPDALCHELLAHDLGRESLFALLTEVCHLKLDRAEETLSAEMVDEYEANMLRVPLNSPAFLVRRVTYDSRGVPVEYAKSILRGDRYRFAVSLTSETSKPTGTSGRTTTPMGIKAEVR